MAWELWKRGSSRESAPATAPRSSEELRARARAEAERQQELRAAWAVVSVSFRESPGLTTERLAEAVGTAWNVDVRRSTSDANVELGFEMACVADGEALVGGAAPHWIAATDACEVEATTAPHNSGTLVKLSLRRDWDVVDGATVADARRNSLRRLVPLAAALWSNDVLSAEISGDATIYASAEALRAATG